MKEFVSITTARAARGLRIAGLRGVPSPWTEAAKGIFYVKKLPVLRAARAPDEPETALTAWAGDVGVPVVAYENEKLRTGWSEILLLAERLAPTPALLPSDVESRALAFGLAHEICGEMGLGWAYRLLMIRESLEHPQKPNTFPLRVAEYLAGRYGFVADAADAARKRVVALLHMLSRRADAGDYLLGDVLTAVDIYWATFANLITPLPESLLPATPMIRNAYTCTDPGILAAISPRLREHQLAVYKNHLELPVVL